MRRKALKPYHKRNLRLKKAGFSSYQDYLNSDHWKQLRRKVLKRDHHQCVACGDPANCVHHTNYTNKTLFGKFEHPPASLVSLCHGCHAFIEFTPEGEKTHPREARKKLRWRCAQHNRPFPGRHRKRKKRQPNSRTNG